MSPSEPGVDAHTAVDLYLLTWTAGVMDALSYLRAHVFTANMTGNTVILGLAAVGPGRARLFDSALAIGTFALGVLIAAVLLVRVRRSNTAEDLRLGTGLEIPFVIFFAVLWAIFPRGGPSWVLIALITSAACALGIQSVAVRRLKIFGDVTTFITGTVTSTIVSAVARNEPGSVAGREARVSPLLLLGMLVLYAIGALAGGLVAGSTFAGAVAAAPLVVVWIRSRG